MAKALTVKALEYLKPGQARREIPDGLIRGLFFVMQPTGKASWAVRYRHAGRPRKLTLGTFPAIDLKNARELASRALVNVAGGADPAGDKQAAKAPRAPADRDLVEKVVPLFLERYAKPNTRDSTFTETERVLNKEIAGRWRGRHLSEIGRADVHAMLDDIMDRPAPILANRTLALFRRMCNWAVERGIIALSPCEGVKAPASAKSRDRVLSDDELRAVWKAAEAIGWPFGPMTQLLVLTGQRRGEVAAMRWQEIDFDARTWTLPKERAKNAVEHVVPLCVAAIAILKTLPRVAGKEGFVFSTNGEASISGFAKGKERLDASPFVDIAPWVIHDLRRTFASGCARLGIDLHVVEKCLNHVSGSFAGFVGVYQRHDFGGEKRAAMDTWGRYVESLLSGEPQPNVVSIRSAVR